MILKQYLDEIKEKKSSWIQELNKEELLEIYEELQLLSKDQTVEILRKTIRELLKSGHLLSYCQEKEEADSEKQMEIPVKTKMCTNYGQIEKFDGKNYELFEQQLECVITLNDIPKTKHTPLLLTNLTTKVLETLNHLCSPNKPIRKEFKDLLQLLETRYTKSTSIALDRAAFRSRNQKHNEKIEDYVKDLKRLAKRCEFKDLEDQVKEKLIDGVNKPLIKFELLKNGETTLDKLIRSLCSMSLDLQRCMGNPVLV